MEIDCARPEKLYRYSQRRWLERSLRLGEFRLMPASYYTALEADIARQDHELCRTRTLAPEDAHIAFEGGQIIRPIGDVVFENRLLRDYLMICFSSHWSPGNAGGFSAVDACLVIHDPDILLERIHAGIDQAMPGGISLDARVSYGVPNELGVAYSKPAEYAAQREHRLTVLAPDDRVLSPLLITIGSIETIAEILPIEATS